jgi:hypothetical protein
MGSENSIHLLSFPSHTIHLLQPLGVGVYRLLQKASQDRLNKYMPEHPGEKLNGLDFNKILHPAYHLTFIPLTITDTFKNGHTSYKQTRHS